MAPNYVMGLDDSPDCFTAVSWLTHFLLSCFCFSVSPMHHSLYPCLSISMFTDLLCFLLLHPPPLSFQLWLLPLLSFSLISLLFYYFFPHLYFWLFLSLYLPTSTTCLSCSISLFISLNYFTFYLSLFPFPPTVLITILISLSFQHVWYSGTRVSCIAGGFFTSWAVREALFKDWHLLTDFSTLMCWGFPGFV